MAFKTNIAVDYQLLQSSDRNRGMGLFTHSLLKAFAANPPTETNWIFIVNQNLSPLGSDDTKIINKLKGRLLPLDLFSKHNKLAYKDVALANRSRISAALSKDFGKSNKNIFFIPALFSNEIYPVFPEIPSLNVMLFHDIIPYLYHKHYFADLEGPAFADYAQRFSEFYTTDLFVTNSQTTADDLSIFFGVDSARAKPILGSGASRAGIKPLPVKHVKKDYILMPSGDDYRKNNLLAALALAELNMDVQLVITSNFNDASKRALTETYPNTTFTGSVSDEEYTWLIDNSKLVLFPSLYEGLGMPVLEAVDRNATVVCSNIPVFVEISSDAFWYFNPNSITELKDTLIKVLDPSSSTEVEHKKELYGSILRKFSWDKAAGTFLKSIISAGSSNATKKRVAVFGPSPKSYSAIGKYIFELHAEASRLYDIDYYFESGSTITEPTRPDILTHISNHFSASSFDPAKGGEYDHIIYHIGNSEFHVSTILNSLRFPANAVIHDTRLKGVFDYMVSRKLITAERKHYEDFLNKMVNSQNSSYLTSIVNNQNSIICHSEYAKSAISELVEENQPVSNLPLPTEAPVINVKRGNIPIISFAGIISENKGINLVKEISALPNIMVKVFGFGALGDSPLLDQTSSNVEVITDLTDKEFQDALRLSDILINYRISYHGETSLSTLEAMRYGTVAIVNNSGWYSELPDEAVIKVNSETEVVEAVKRLLRDGEMRQVISKKAQSYIRLNHKHLNYIKALEEKIK